MKDTAKIILDQYQVRKSRAQKTAFLNFMQQRYPQAKIEAGGLLGNRNLVVGDVDNAELVLTAHYDTCAELPFPNFITPKNLALYLGYNLLIALPFLAIGILCSHLVGLTPFLDGLQFTAFYIGAFGTMFAVFFGKANPHTVNDNTSGVITLVELLDSMTEAERQRVAFVFFDNEEYGLLGSMRFAGIHKKAMKDKLLINFDCVSDGNHLLFVLQKGAQRYAERIRTAFLPCAGKEVLVEKASSALYPSDQTNFPCGVGVAALNKKKGLGLYMNRIHTKRDTVFMQENILCLVDGVKRYLNSEK